MLEIIKTTCGIIVCTPIVITGFILHIGVIYISLASSPIPLGIEHMISGKIDKTKKYLNNAVNIDRIIMNEFIKEKENKLNMRIFWP